MAIFYCWQDGNGDKQMSKRPSLAESMKAVTTPAEPVARVAGAAALPVTALPERSEVRPYFAATRTGMKRLTVVVPPEEHRRVKRLSVDTDRSIEDLMREALTDLLNKHNAS